MSDIRILRKIILDWSNWKSMLFSFMTIVMSLINCISRTIDIKRVSWEKFFYKYNKLILGKEFKGRFQEEKKRKR